MNKANVALVKLAIGLLSVGAVAGVAGRLSTGAPGQGEGQVPRDGLVGTAPPDVRLDAPADRFGGEEGWYGGEEGERAWRGYRLAPGQGAGGYAGRRRTWTRQS